MNLLTFDTPANPFTKIDLMVLGLVIPLWTWGILSARKHHVSRIRQIIFTIIMFGGASGDVLLGQIAGRHPDFVLVTSFLIWLSVLVVGGVKLIPDKHPFTYPCFVIGASLIYLSFFFPGTARLAAYVLLVLGFLLVGSSMLLARRATSAQKA